MPQKCFLERRKKNQGKRFKFLGRGFLLALHLGLSGSVPVSVHQHLPTGGVSGSRSVGQYQDIKHNLLKVPSFWPFSAPAYHVVQGLWVSVCSR